MTLDEWVSQFKMIQPKSRELWKAIRWEFEEQDHLMTVRQMFYRMSSAGYVPKSENGYRRVQYALLKMRQVGAIPYEWIADNTRYCLRPDSYSNMLEALQSWQKNYRRALWQEQPVYVEIWLEKDALRGVLSPITMEYDVPLYVTRGYSSQTFLYDAAQFIKSTGKKTVIYHIGDYDPSGRDAAQKVKETLYGFGARFDFVELAVTERQIADMNLPERPTKKSDSRSKKWLASGRGGSVEVDAIPPNELRRLLRSAIEQHITSDEIDYIRRIEHEEIARIRDLSNQFWD